jgi:hypothetical protein
MRTLAHREIAMAQPGIPATRPPHVHDDLAQVRTRHAVLIARHGGEAEHPHEA